MEPAEFFIESTYIDSQGKERLCYECTKLGCDMLANKMTGKKGIAFTAKYVKAFNDMQKAIEQVGQLVQQQPQAQIGPRYSFSNYWIKRELSTIKPTDIPEYVDELLEYIKSNRMNILDDSDGPTLRRWGKYCDTEENFDNNLDGISPSIYTTQNSY
jgi:hypothetical protein